MTYHIIINASSALAGYSAWLHGNIFQCSRVVSFDKDYCCLVLKAIASKSVFYSKVFFFQFLFVRTWSELNW